MVGYQRVRDPVVPAARGFDEAALQLFKVWRGGLRGQGQQYAQADQRAVRDVDREGVGRGAETFLQHGDQGFAQVRVKAVARGIDKARDKALERIRPHEQGCPDAVRQHQDALADGEQVVFVDQENVVTRVVVQDMRQGLAVVAARIAPGAIQHPRDFLPEPRHFLRDGAVGQRCEKPEEEAQARQSPVRVEAPDADQIVRGDAVNAGFGLRLVDEQDFRVRR